LQLDGMLSYAPLAATAILPMPSMTWFMSTKFEPLLDPEPELEPEPVLALAVGAAELLAALGRTSDELAA
jgi:hypothetical protein